MLVESPSHSFSFFIKYVLLPEERKSKNNKTIGPIQEKTLPFPWCLLTAAGAHATSVLMGVDSLVVVSRERQPYIS